jgi:hypothetical protein
VIDNFSSHVSEPRRAFGADDEIETIIIGTILQVTGKTVTPEWARRIEAHILDGRAPRNRVAYLRRAILSEPDPKTRFLQH